MKVTGRMPRWKEKENLSGKMEQNMRETLKMVISMDLAFTPIQKKAQMTSMKVIGRMESNQERESLSSKMEPSKKEPLKMVHLNINQTILKLCFCVKFTVILSDKMSILNFKEYDFDFKNVTKVICCVKLIV
jgi:hypothetical protein